MSDAQVAIVVTLVGYKLLLLAIGFLAQRRTHDATDLYLGGRRLGPLVAAISASASSSSAWTLLGVSAAAYRIGIAAVWLFVACVGGFCLNWFLVAPRLRRHATATGAVTLTDVLAGSGRHAGRIRLVASVIVILSLLTYVASQFHGAGKSFDTTFPQMNGDAAVLLSALIVILYTILGGFWAVSLTDTLQGLLMALTAVLLPAAALIEVGGPAALAKGIDRIGGSYADVFAGLPFLAGTGMVLGYLGIGLGYPGQPHVVNRFMALADDAGVRRARAYSLLWAVLVYSGMILLGLCARVLAVEVPQGDPERLFLLLADRLFHPIVTGIMLAAVLSAMMSTTDSQLLVAAAAVSHDLGLARRTGSSLWLHRAVILLLSLLALTLALTIANPRIFEQVLSAWTAMGAAFGPILLLVLFGRPPGGVARCTAMIVGFGSAMLTHMWPQPFLHGVDRWCLPFLGSTLCLLLLPRERLRGHIPT